MARKRMRKTARSHRRGRRGRKSYYKSAVGKGEVMVNRTKARLHNVVAPHYLTRLEYGFSGNLLGPTAGAQGYFNVWANGLTFPGDKQITPFGGGQNLSGFVDFTDASAGGTLYPATHALTALNPVGLATLSFLYEKYRVFASKIDITFNPTSTVPVLMAVLPVNGEALGQGSPDPGNNIQLAQSSPYAKAIQCTQNNNVKQNRISSYMDMPTMIGYTKQQYKDDPLVCAYSDYSNPGLTESELATQQNQYSAVCWQVNLSPMASASQMAGTVEVRVTYWVEFFEPVPPADT